jgi:DNA-binding GntR family transcriptional regulator
MVFYYGCLVTYFITRSYVYYRYFSFFSYIYDKSYDKSIIEIQIERVKMAKILISKPGPRRRINRSSSGGAEALASQSMADQFISYITDGICNQKFIPGTRISERGVAKDLGISQVLAREYMEKLIHHGWVERIPGRGISVRKFNQEELQELFEYRELIETGAIFYVADSITDSQLAELRSKVELMESLEPDPDTEQGNLIKSADIEFHKLIVHFMGNQRVKTSFKSVISQISFLFYSRGPTKILHEIYVHRATNPLPEIKHRKILEALESRDPILAEQRMRDHIRYASSLAIFVCNLFQIE